LVLLLLALRLPFLLLLLLRPLLPTTLPLQTCLRATACWILWLQRGLLRLLVVTKVGSLIRLGSSSLSAGLRRFNLVFEKWGTRKLREKIAQATETVVQKTHSSATMRIFYVVIR
jgi:hypothetical protein